MKKALSFLLSIVMVLSMSFITVFADGNVAKIGDTEYATLAEAVAAANAATGDVTITLLADSAEDVTIEQRKDVDIIFEGTDGATYSGTITIQGNNRYEGDETLTIQNVDFVTSEASHYFIDSNSQDAPGRYSHNVTVTGCTFTATGAGVNSAAAMRIRQGFNIIVEDVEATGMHSLLQGYGIAGLTVSEATISGGKNGISVGTSTNVSISDVAITATGYGVRADGTGGGDLTVTGAEIEAENPIIVRNTTSDYSLEVKNSDLTAGNADGHQVILTANDDEDPLSTPTSNFNVVVDNTVGKGNVYPENSAVVENPDYSFSVDVTEFNVGEATDVNVTLTGGAEASTYSSVQIVCVITDEEGNVVQEGKHGPDSGFTVNAGYKVTTELADVTFDEVGTYDVTFTLVDVANNNEVIATTVIEITVVDPNADDDNDEVIIEEEEEEEEEEYLSVTAKILWEGKAVSDGVEVKLLKNDRKYKTETLVATKWKHTNWRHTWAELDPEEEWTIEVIVPDGYECEIDEYGDNDFEITLTQVKAPVSEPVEEINPNTGAI